MTLIKSVNGVEIEFTAEETAAYNARFAASWKNDPVKRKLYYVKNHRQKKLDETDWWVSRGAMTDAQKAWRQSLRDIPTTYTTEADYDALLAVDEDKNLTHTIWEKP